MAQPTYRGYFSSVWLGTISLIKGLLVTLKYTFSPQVTLQYPEQREEMPEGYRGPVQLIEHPGCKHACVADGLCAKACPVACLDVRYEIGEDKKRKLTYFEYDMSHCLFCGLCVEACNFDALEMSKNYETSVYDRNKLVMDLMGKLEGPIVSPKIAAAKAAAAAAKAAEMPAAKPPSPEEEK